MRLFYFLPLLIFLVFAGFMYKSLSLKPDEIASALEGKQMPDFELTNLFDANKNLTKKDLLGEVFLLNVWSTWCKACDQEHSFLLDLNQKNIKIIGLNYKEKARNLPISALYGKGNPFYYNIYDPDGSLALDLGVYGAPESYLIDKNGFVLYKHVGLLNQSIWDEHFAKLIKDAR